MKRRRDGHDIDRRILRNRDMADRLDDLLDKFRPTTTMATLMLKGVIHDAKKRRTRRAA